MSGFYKKAVVWLGLNEEYPDDDFDGAEQHERVVAPTANARAAGPDGPESARASNSNGGQQREAAPGRSAARLPSQATVRAVPMDEPTESEHADSGSVGSSPRRQEASSGTVRAVPMAKTTKPQVVIPKSFNDAQDVADMFKDAKPVIVNMQNAERDLARRLIDFSSGLCYGLGGQMEKVAKDVYLLTPDDVEVDDAERERYN